MSWGSALAGAWSGASAAGRAAAQRVATSTRAAYEFTTSKAAVAYDYGKEKATEGATYAKEAAERAYQATTDAVARARDSVVQHARDAKQAAISGGKLAVQSATRGAIEARYLQGLGPAGAAKYAYVKAKESLGLNQAGNPTQGCPLKQKKCRDLEDALNKAEIADDTYNLSPPPGTTVAGYQRLDPDRDRAELSRLLETKSPQSVLQPADSDFRASVYKRVKNGRVEYVMGFRGTQTPEDWIENLAQGTGQVGPGRANPTKNQSYKRAMELAKSVSRSAEQERATVSFTGHSLGGGMASAAAAATGMPASTFNAAGLHPNTVGGSLPRPPAPVDAYYSPTDILNGVQDNGASVLADIATRITATGAKVPWIKNKMTSAGLPEWAMSDDVAAQQKAPRAYGTRRPLPFPSGVEPPSPLDIKQGHGMPLVKKGIKQEQKNAGCL